ncbi:MAG: NAD-dependent epimerase/dehydratase family protein, partial [Acidobacteriota bacterium]|nr:NAD-dependent epimerase/dehydratase family protein [Acidobacteriota bacterium]
MKILVSGASGLIGTHLVPTLLAKGNQIYKLVRNQPGGIDEIEWSVKNDSIDEEKLEGFDAVIHLAGDNVASENWSDEKKKGIRDSRVRGTRLLVDALKRRIAPPKHFISASAIGFYGDQGADAFLFLVRPVFRSDIIARQMNYGIKTFEFFFINR